MAVENLPSALPVGREAVRRRNPSTALRYSAATGDATLGELAEWVPGVAEPFAPAALISASGLSERRETFLRIGTLLDGKALGEDVAFHNGRLPAAR